MEVGTGLGYADIMSPPRQTGQAETNSGPVFRKICAPGARGSRPPLISEVPFASPPACIVTVTLIEPHRAWKRARQAGMVAGVRRNLRTALDRHLPGITVWVSGSPAKPERFSAHSDVDLAVRGLPRGMTIELLPSLLSRDVGREVDVCLLDSSRFREAILREGERWTP